MILKYSGRWINQNLEADAAFYQKSAGVRTRELKKVRGSQKKSSQSTDEIIRNLL
jgi:hypothetical protein